MKLLENTISLILFIGLVALVILNASSFISGANLFFDVTSTFGFMALLLLSFCAQCSHEKLTIASQNEGKAELHVRLPWYLFSLSLIVIALCRCYQP